MNVIRVLALAGALAFTMGAPSVLAQTGNVNCDLRTDSRDAVLILQRQARLILEPACYAEADVDRSGTADAVDALMILQFEAGLWDGAL